MAKENTNQRTGDKVVIGGDYQYNAFYSGSALQRCWHRFKLITAISDLGIKDGMRLLDVGCGSGMLAALVAKENPTVDITGIDGNMAAVAFCREQWKALSNCAFAQGRIDELGAFAGGSIDGIAFLEVIEHITEQQAMQVMEGFYRILRAGGVLVVSTPNRKSVWPLLEWIMDFFRLAPRLKGDQHEKLYSGDELSAMARSAGFTVWKKRRINFIAPWVAVVSEKYARRVHDWEIRQGWIPGSILLYTLIKPRTGGG